jgi:ribonuclease P protein component
LVYRSNDLNTSRLLITLRKKFGTAVERNRARRLVKEAYRNQKYGIRSGYDIAFVVYRKGMSYAETAEALISLLKQTGLYEN